MTYQIDPQVGDFVSQTLVTDSTAYVVVARTAQTLTLVPAGHGEIVERESNGSPYPVVYTEVVAPEIHQGTRRIKVRRRKNGHFAVGGGRPLYMTPKRNGKPVTRVDYSF